MNWPDTWMTETYRGGNNDWGWGDALTRDAVIDSGFGVSLKVRNPSANNATALVDHVHIGVHYSCTPVSREVE